MPTVNVPLRLADRLLRVLTLLTHIYGVGILALFLASLIAPEWTFRALGVPVARVSGASYMGMRSIMVAGLLSVPIYYAVLSRLRGIVHTVQERDPFVLENATRLRWIAWAVLALQVIHLVIYLIAWQSGSAAEPLDINWSFNVTPWLVVAMLFVLADVFDSGARMRADLEGTV